MAPRVLLVALAVVLSAAWGSDDRLRDDGSLHIDPSPGPICYVAAN